MFNYVAFVLINSVFGIFSEYAGHCEGDQGGYLEETTKISSISRVSVFLVSYIVYTLITSTV